MWKFKYLRFEMEKGNFIIKNKSQNSIQLLRKLIILFVYKIKILNNNNTTTYFLDYLENGSTKFII